ncbi:MAG: zinc-dependent alcohol dehydrogenase [Trueperaceae bacterium]
MTTQIMTTQVRTTKHMNAAFIHGNKDMRLGTMPSPERKSDELLLRVRAVGVCGSDLHYYLEGGIGSAQIREPLVLGHEFSAEIVDERAEAPEFKHFGFKRGQLVAVDPAKFCYTCEWCERGHHNLCPNVEFTGAPPYHGAMREYITVSPKQIFPVPEGFSADDAVMLEPLGIALHALDLTKLKPMASVTVLGCGTIGLLILQVAKLCGAGTVYAVDPLEYRLDVAKQLGADVVVKSHQEVLQYTNGRGTDVVIEATNSPLGPRHATETVAIGGEVILVGIPEGDEFSMTASLIRRKGLTIKLSRRMGKVYPKCIYMLHKKLVNVKPIITHHFPLAQTAKAFEMQASYQDNSIKSMINVS